MISIKDAQTWKICSYFAFKRIFFTGCLTKHDRWKTTSYLSLIFVIFAAFILILEVKFFAFLKWVLRILCFKKVPFSFRQFWFFQQIETWTKLLASSSGKNDSTKMVDHILKIPEPGEFCDFCLNNHSWKNRLINACRVRRIISKIKDDLLTFHVLRIKPFSLHWKI